MSTLEDRTKKRLPRHERERLIVDEAVKFFAEVGFEGQTRALAERLGVTQPLLYRYFPDKEALIERVYEELFMGGWDHQWNAALADRSVPLRERLTDFYLDYTNANFSYERVRLFTYAGLKHHSLTRRYLAFLRDHLFAPVCRELRAELGHDDQASEPSPRELELVAGLHGAITYGALRMWVYNDNLTPPLDALVAQQVELFLDGAPAAFTRQA